MIKLTSKWLKEQNACDAGREWWNEHKSSDPIKTINTLMDDNHFDWANWLIVRVMTHEQQIKYAIFAAEKVTGIYEKQYPNDACPRKAIEAAKEYLKYPDKTHQQAAHAAYAVVAAYFASCADMERTIIEYGISLLVEVER